MFAKFIHVEARVGASFLLTAEYCPTPWTATFVYPLAVDGHWGHVHLLVTVNHVAVNMHVEVFVWAFNPHSSYPLVTYIPRVDSPNA